MFFSTFFYLEPKKFYKIDFYVRNKDNEVLDHVTEAYQSRDPHEEQEPPPPVILEPDPVTSDMIRLSWKEPKSDVAILQYIVSYRQRNEEDTYNSEQFLKT